MKKKLFFAFLFAAAVAIGCKKSVEEIKISPIELEKIEKHIVSSSQAQKVAVLNSIFPEPLKRGSAKNSGNGTMSVPITSQRQKNEKSVKNIVSVKEGQINATLHVINYSEGGWVIVSGDDRMEPILAFSDTGKFVMTSISKLRPGVSQWMEGNHRYISDLRSGKMHRSINDSLGINALWKDLVDKSEITKGNYSVLEAWPTCNELFLGITQSSTVQYGPWTVSKWGQDRDGKSLTYDWNEFCPAGSCSPNRTLVGCVGVSIAQIAYFHQYPSDPSLNWSDMYPDSATFNSAWLLKLCAEKVYTSYGCGASSAAFSATNNAFSNLGYSSANSSSFDFDDAASELASGYPIILAADYSLFVGGHQWVADGVMYMETYTCSEYSSEPTPPGGVSSKQPQTKVLPPSTYYGWTYTWANDYFRMNWGWGGPENGWFSASIWTVAGREYDYGMKMCIGIRP